MLRFFTRGPRADGSHHLNECLDPLLRCLSASAAIKDPKAAMEETVQAVSRSVDVDPALAVPLEAPLALLFSFRDLEEDEPTAEAAMALGEEVLIWSRGRASTADRQVVFAVAGVYRLGFDATQDLAHLDRAERLFDLLLSRSDPGEHWFHWASTGLTDIHHQGQGPGKDVQNGDHGEEEAASASLVHSGVQG